MSFYKPTIVMSCLPTYKSMSNEIVQRTQLEGCCTVQDVMSRRSYCARSMFGRCTLTLPQLQRLACPFPSTQQDKHVAKAVGGYVRSCQHSHEFQGLALFPDKRVFSCCVLRGWSSPLLIHVQAFLCSRTSCVPYTRHNRVSPSWVDKRYVYTVIRTPAHS